MNLVTFFSKLDTNALTVSIGFYGIYLGIHFSLFEAVGDLKNIRDRVIYHMATANQNLPVVAFLEKLYSESKVLVLEPKKRSRALYNSLAVFGLMSILAIAYEPLAVLAPIMPEREKILFGYVAAFATTMWFCLYEVNYFREFRRLEKKYPPDSAGDAKQIRVTRQASPSTK